MEPGREGPCVSSCTETTCGYCSAIALLLKERTVSRRRPEHQGVALCCENAWAFVVQLVRPPAWIAWLSALAAPQKVRREGASVSPSQGQRPGWRRRPPPHHLSTIPPSANGQPMSCWSRRGERSGGTSSVRPRRAWLDRARQCRARWHWRFASARRHGRKNGLPLGIAPIARVLPFAGTTPGPSARKSFGERRATRGSRHYLAISPMSKQAISSALRTNNLPRATTGWFQVLPSRALKRHNSSCFSGPGRNQCHVSVRRGRTAGPGPPGAALGRCRNRASARRRCRPPGECTRVYPSRSRKNSR